MKAFKFIQTDQVELNGKTRLLKAADYLSYESANQVMQLARERAEAIAEQAEEERRQERQKGYEEGQLQSRKEQLEQAILLAARTVEYFSSIEKQVTDIVLTAVRRVLGEFNDVDLVVKAVKNVLHTIGGEKQLSLRVANKQADAVKARVSEILSAYPAIAFIEVVGDNRLSATDCILESELGVVEASVEVQVQSLKNALQAHFESHKSEA